MLNRCDFIGRLGKDPEIRYSQSGDAIASLSIACSESWKDKQGQKQEKTEWIGLVCFGKLAEIIGEYVHKGSLIYVSGKYQTRSWDDKDGNKRYTTEIVVKDMKMLDGKGKSQGGQQGQQEYEPPQGNGRDDSQEVPF